MKYLQLILIHLVVMMISLLHLPGYTAGHGAFSEGGEITDCQRIIRLSKATGRPIPERCGGPSAAEQNDCQDLEKTVRLKADELEREYRKWEGIEKDYLEFYDASRYEMHATFDKAYYELPSPIPFSSSANLLFKVEKNIALRHMPLVKIQAPSEIFSVATNTITILSDLASLGGPASQAIGGDINTINAWFQHFGKSRLEKEFTYDEGVGFFRKLMIERQAVLDNYRRLINLYFCKKILPKERYLFVLRTEQIPASPCQNHVKSAMEGWAARPTRYRNEQQFSVIDGYCSAFE